MCLMQLSEKQKTYLTLKFIAKSHIKTRDGSLSRYSMVQDQKESLIAGRETTHFSLSREPQNWKTVIVTV